MTERCTCPEAARQAQIISPPPLCFTIDMKFCADMLCSVFCCSGLWTNITRHCSTGFQTEKRFSADSLSKHFCSAFLQNLPSWSLTFTFLTEPCGVWDVNLEFPEASPSIVPNLLRRLWHCVNTSLPKPCFYRGACTADDQLIKSIWLAAPGCCPNLIIPMKTVSVYRVL